MNAPQAKIYLILPFKLHMDARWDSLPLWKISPPPGIGQSPWKWRFPDLLLKFETSISQLPPNLRGRGGCTLCNFFWILCFEQCFFNIFNFYLWKQLQYHWQLTIIGSKSYFANIHHPQFWVGNKVCKMRKN